MAIPTKLEVDVLLNARDEFRRRPDLQRLFGVTPSSSAEQQAQAALRYANASLKCAKDDRMWPGNAGNPTTK